MAPFSATVSTAHTPCSFDHLSTELKVLILGYRLVLVHPINPKTHRIHMIYLESLFLASKAVYQLASEIYYSSNTFVVGRKLFSESKWPVTIFPNFAVAHWIRKLELHINMYDLEYQDWRRDRSINQFKDVETALRSRVDLFYLVRPLDPVARPCLAKQMSSLELHPRRYEMAQWQKYLTRIRVLKVVLHGAGKCGPQLVQLFRDLPKYTCIEVKPKHVDVTVDGMECRHIIGNHSTSCPRIIEGIIRGMIHLRTD